MFCVSMCFALASDGRAPRENPCFSVVLNDIIRQNIDRRVADQSRDFHFRGVPVMPRSGMTQPCHRCHQLAGMDASLKCGRGFTYCGCAVMQF